MSAFIGMAFRDRIEIVADGAVTNPEGLLIGIENKIWHSERYPIAVTGVGGMATFRAVTGVVDDAIKFADTFDEVLQWVERDLPSIGTEASRLGGFSILIALWSPTGPRLLKLRNVPDTSDGPLPDIAVEDAGKSYGSGPGLSFKQMQELGVTFRNGLRDDGIVILDAMRQIGQPTDSGELQHWIGGHIDHAVVRPDGVRIERVHTWPDVIGEKINAKQEWKPRIVNGQTFTSKDGHVWHGPNGEIIVDDGE